MGRNSSEINVSRYWEAWKVLEIPEGEQNPRGEQETKVQIKAKAKPQTKPPKQTSKEINKKPPGFLILSSEVGQENIS